MFKLLNPVSRELSSNLAPEKVIRNIGLHVGEPSGFLKSNCKSIFAGKIYPSRGEFYLKNHSHNMKRSGSFVLAEGEVSKAGSGSLVRYTMKMRKSNLFGLLFTLVLFLIATIGISLDQFQASPETAYYMVPLVVIGGLTAGFLFLTLVRFSARRELAVIQSYLEKQTQMEISI